MVRRISIPARGRWFEPGQRVRGVEVDGREDIAPDDRGDERVHACARRAWDGPTEREGGAAVGDLGRASLLRRAATRAASLGTTTIPPPRMKLLRAYPVATNARRTAPIANPYAICRCLLRIVDGHRRGIRDAHQWRVASARLFRGESSVMELAFIFSGLIAAFVTCAAWATRSPAPPSPREE